MKIENSKQVTQLKIRNFILRILFASAIVITFIDDQVKWEAIGLYKYLVVLIIVGVFFLMYLITFLKNNHYFNFTIEGHDLLFRYYSLRPFSPKKAIRFPLYQLHRFEIKKVYGFKTSLFLYQETEKGVASYKPISLMALKKADRDLLEEVLNRVIEKNK